MTASCRLQAGRCGRRGQRPPGSGTFSSRKSGAGDAGGAPATSARERGCSRSQLVVFPSRLVAGYLLELSNAAVCWCPQSHGMSASPEIPKGCSPRVQKGARKQRTGGSRAGLGERLLLGEPGAVQTSPNQGDRAPSRTQEGPLGTFQVDFNLCQESRGMQRNSLEQELISIQSFFVKEKKVDMGSPDNSHCYFASSP